MTSPDSPRHAHIPRVAIIGGGPGGYEAALVAVNLGAQVSLIEREGLGGSAVLTDCVPSKTLIATAEVMHTAAHSPQLGVVLDSPDPTNLACSIGVDLGTVNGRVFGLSQHQSSDIHQRLAAEGVQIHTGHGRIINAHHVQVTHHGGHAEIVECDAILIATGARPRVLPTAAPDGHRILTWTQLYSLQHLPEHLIVVGSGVTGAEFASAFRTMGSEVTLISSRDQVLPGKDPDAAQVLEHVFNARGLRVLSKCRAQSAQRVNDHVEVRLADGRTVTGSHCLMAVGSVPNTSDLGLDNIGVDCDTQGRIMVDRVSRTTAAGVYAAGDCTDVLPLASVAAMQGRLAMRHLLGEAVTPLDLQAVAANVFTSPEIAMVGCSHQDVESGAVSARSVTVPLARNARAKMQGLAEGFVKLFAQPSSGLVLGGVVVAPGASELIYPIAVAVRHGLSVDHLASAFTVYPSLSGSIAEASRQLSSPQVVPSQQATPLTGGQKPFATNH